MCLRAPCTLSALDSFLTASQRSCCVGLWWDISEFAFVINQDRNINLFVQLYVNIRLKNGPRDTYSQRNRTYHTQCCIPAHAGRKGGGGHQETRSMLVCVGPSPTALQGRNLVPGRRCAGPVHGKGSENKGLTRAHSGLVRLPLE